MSMTVEQVLAEVAAAKKIAEARFMKESGGRTAKQFVNECLRPEIESSKSPEDAMRNALRRA